ncbi:hypothetical protein D1BOALGB6SA_4342 [Olavius sp. associated proteobacterium Delta 1]|nr:hypothetical protein D1BOALGB6SA_4342 [Olavius sp. associated proteobacterium Delta 1]
MTINQLKIPASFQKGWVSLWGPTLVVFLIFFIFFCYFFSKIPLLHDGDSYYHLAVARLYVQQGFVDQLDWARFSAMHSGFGDKELLFHALLMPFVRWLPSELGGKLALALLNALTAAVLANLSIRSIGKWGVFVPVWLFGTSAAFTLRMSRLRPEILSLLIMMAATWVASQKKYRWVMILAALYALSYTAVHVLVGLSIGWFVVIWWIERRWEWRLPVYVTIGAVIGLAVHPHFPSNLNIWLIQNIDFFLLKNHLDVGNEIQPSSITTILSLNLGWLLGLVIFWRSATKNHARSKTTGTELLFLVNALAFSLLYLLMQRFSIYCVPFVTIALLYHMNYRNLEIGRWTYLPWRGKLPFVATFGLCLCTSILSAWYVYVNLSDHSVFDINHRKDWQALGQIIPQGAKVAAPWDATELYVWAAPQARYLNLLDPVFMAVPYGSAYLILKNIWNGDEPDVPYTVKAHLDSDYIVFPYKRHTQLYRRLLHDPRAKLLYRGHSALFRLMPDKNNKFMVNWQIIPDNGKWPPEEGDINKKEIYFPQQVDPIGQGYERYVNATRSDSNTGCINLARVEEVEEPVNVEYEISSYGPSSIWHNEKLIIKNLFPAKATLGQGVRLSLELESGRHIFSIRTCPDKRQNGFYFLERSRSLLN